MSDRVQAVKELKQAIRAIDAAVDAIDARLRQSPPEAEEIELETRKGRLLAERARLKAKLDDVLAGGGTFRHPTSHDVETIKSLTDGADELTAEATGASAVVNIAEKVLGVVSRFDTE